MSRPNPPGAGAARRARIRNAYLSDIWDALALIAGHHERIADSLARLVIAADSIATATAIKNLTDPPPPPPRLPRPFEGADEAIRTREKIFAEFPEAVQRADEMPPVFPTFVTRHELERVQGNRFCGYCGGGKDHAIHRA